MLATVAADPGIASVAPTHIDRATGIATLVVFPTTSPQDKATADTIARYTKVTFEELAAAFEAIFGLRFGDTPGVDS